MASAMSNPQKVTVLGSTGSIGVSTLEVMAAHPDRFQVFALSAATRVDALLAQCVQFKPAYAVMSSAPHARQLADRVRELGLPTVVLSGPQALDEVASDAQVDMVMAAIVGAAGLSSCLAAANSGKRLLLANKEALVVGGDFFMQAVARGGATLLPIDSEHSAIFQSLPTDRRLWGERIDKLILTASGGPFRTRDPATFADITPAQACAHPNWVMGQKISVDSATMMNKALEVIEARYLFDMAPERIEVVIHPQSVIHSMVQYRDHSVIAQLGTPDMKVPIAYGLSWPDRITSGASALDFSSMAAMTFESLEEHGHAQRFAGLQLSWQALRAAPGTTAVLNAANEEAVAGFLQGALRFDHIHAVNEETLNRLLPSAPSSLEDLLALDAQARQTARGVMQTLGGP
jgi:1-deoxy-D-xylulose-5-phosphate reductoisomerase